MSERIRYQDSDALQSSPRDPTAEELGLIRRLLSHGFQGASELSRQCDGLKVSSIRNEASLSLYPVPRPEFAAEVKYSPPVEGVARDTDGVPIHIVLHVRNGYLSELEVFREDSERIAVMPEETEVDVY